MTDPYTLELRMCDDAGQVDGVYLALLNRLRAIGGHGPYRGDRFACTGSAHLAGQHIRCTSPVHAQVIEGAPLNGWQVMTAAPVGGNMNTGTITFPVRAA